MPKVSVIIPSYNHEKFVAEAIESVLNQTYQDFEIVITDDGSADNTVNIIKQFIDSRIRLFCFAKNRGAAVAANNCLKESRGELIAMLSSDDAFVPDKLAKQVNFLQEHSEVGAVFSYAHIIDENGNDYAQQNHFYKQIFIQPNRNRFEWLNHFFYKGNCLCHPSALIRKKCYNDVGQYDERFAQLPDFDFWIRLCMKYQIYIMPEELIKFRIRTNEANASGNRPEVKRRTLLEYKYILKNFLNSEIYHNYSKIFPNDAYKLSEFNQYLRAFQVALLAVKVEYPPHQSFAVDTFYEILNKDEETIQKIKDELDFDFINLIKLTGKQDVFGIIKLDQRQSQLQQTQVELERSQSQLQHTQVELERSRSRLQHTQTQFEQAHSQLQHTQVELERSHSQLQHTQVELERSQSQLQHTQVELERSQSQLQHTQVELERSQSQLQHTQVELERSQSQLQHTQVELERSQSQLQHTQTEFERSQSQQYHEQVELEQVKGRITAIESSKFWKLRKAWFRLKRVLRLKADE